MSFEVEVKLQEDLTRKLQEAQKKLRNLKPLFSQIGHTLIESVEENFEDESFFGKRWMPLADATKKQKAKKGYKKILQNRGRLAESIDFEASSNRLILGTNIEYAPIHQFGGKAGRGKKVDVPARPFLPIDQDKEIPKEAQEEILEAVEFYLSNLL